MNTILCGIDEAGRGCIAGSLFIVAVVLQEKFVTDFQRLGIKDSKQLSFMQRNVIAIQIMQYLHTHNGFYYIVNFNAQQIDEFGLKTCMQRGLQKLCDFAKTRGAMRIIFDGNTNLLLVLPLFLRNIEKMKKCCFYIILCLNIILKIIRVI